jgi:magnesium transporter
MKELILAAKEENLHTAVDFIDEELKKCDCARKARLQIAVITEEIFINIANYAYSQESGSALIRIHAEDGVVIEFEDRGMPYNPLETPDPDINISIEEREPGGLGILMVKKLADKVEYRREDDRNLLTIRKYPEFSTGKIMTADFVRLTKEMRVDDALKQISLSDNIYTCYITDDNSILEGAVTVKQLLSAESDSLIKDVMDTDIIYAHVSDRQDETAQLFSEHELLSLPVVDCEKRLTGIISIRDAINVIQREATEDFERMAALTPSEKPYFEMGIFTLSRNRIVWLLVLMLTATLTGMIIGHFEAALLAAPILATFIPMMMDTGGNAGSQTSALIIRGMALGEIHIKDIAKIVWREAQIGVICGSVLGLVNFVRVMLMNGGNALLSLAVTVSLIVTVIVAKTAGCMMPVVAKKLGIDPTVMAAPLITTVTDVAALLFFFSFAKMILGI